MKVHKTLRSAFSIALRGNFHFFKGIITSSKDIFQKLLKSCSDPKTNWNGKATKMHIKTTVHFKH